MSDGRAVIGVRGKALTAADTGRIGKVSNAATGVEGGADTGIWGARGLRCGAGAGAVVGMTPTQQPDAEDAEIAQRTQRNIQENWFLLRPLRILCVFQLQKNLGECRK